MAKLLEVEQLDELKKCLEFVEDPRVQGRSKHLLIDILVLSVLATICGAEGIWEIHLFGEQKKSWLERFLELPCGIPSHDTIARVLSIINPLQMEAAFSHWVQDTLINKKELSSISLDGKAVKGTDRSFNRGTRPLTMVSAYAHELGLSLAQAEARSTGQAECEAAIECLKLLDIKNVVIMMDAGIGTKKVINQIKDQGGHYIVPVKGNHAASQKELISVFKVQSGKNQKVSEKSHGRKVERHCQLLSACELSKEFLDRFRDVQTIFMITRVREEKDKRFAIQTTGRDGKQTYIKNDNDIKRREEVTYYASSLVLSPKEAMSEVQKHWQIENNLHWTLDVSFGEDDCRVRLKSLAQSLTFIRKIALNIIKSSNTKGSIKGRMKKAGWNNEYLEQIIFGAA